MEDVSYQSQELNHLGIIAGVCSQISLIQQIDAMIGPSERTMTVGEAVQAMILNALGFVNHPLYLTPEFFENTPVDILLRAGLTAEDLNEHSLGRALDKLYEQGITEVFFQLASHALQVYGIDPEGYHVDSTSVSFHGTYDAQEDRQALRITQGYSRDQRPDLKQAIVSLICTYKSALPVWLEVHDGNQIDKTLFPQMIDAYIQYFTIRYNEQYHRYIQFVE